MESILTNRTRPLLHEASVVLCLQNDSKSARISHRPRKEERLQQECHPRAADNNMFSWGWVQRSRVKDFTANSGRRPEFLSGGQRICAPVRQ
uniref:Uncharacterized protein n=1 Tax=Anguilla anguilla TaxID=7936 RepID=A0A0E9WT99_ANGAN